jgi:hypothetical protein
MFNIFNTNDTVQYLYGRILKDTPEDGKDKCRNMLCNCIKMTTE